MSDINEIRKLAGLTQAPAKKEKIDESAIGMDCSISQTVSYRPETDMDKWAKIIAEAEAETETPEKLDEHVVGDYSNGYGQEHYANGDDYFPSGATSAVVSHTGPSSSKQGDNPMQKAIKDNKKDEIHEEMVHAYRNFIKD